MSGPASVVLCPEIPARLQPLFALADHNGSQALPRTRRRQRDAARRSPLTQALAGFAHGYALLQCERIDEAEPLLDGVYQRLVALGRPRLARHVRRSLLYAAMLRGNDAALAEKWAALAAEYESDGDQLSAARARLGQMVPLNLQGQPQAALSIGAQIESTLIAQGAPGDQAWLLRLRGVAHTYRAAFDDATACLSRAEAIFSALEQRAEVAKTWFAFATLYDERGNIDQAVAYIVRARDLCSQLALSLRVALCDKNLGWYAALRGEYDRGLQLSLQAYDELAAHARIDYMAGCDLNMGNIAYFAGLWDLALRAYRRAEAVYTQLKQRRMILIARHNQAQALRLSGQPELALAQISEMLALAEQFDEPIEAARIYRFRGQCLADLGQVRAAEQALIFAERQLRAQSKLVDAGECLVERAQLYLRRGDIDLAEPILREARPLVAPDPILAWQIDYGLGRCAELRGDLHAALALFIQASRIVADLRQRLSNEHASSGLFTQARQLAEDALRRAWQLDNPEALLVLAELQRSLALTAQVRAGQASVLAPNAYAKPAWETTEPPGPLDSARQQDLQAYLERRLRRRRTLPSSAPDPAPSLNLPELRAAFQRAFPDGWTLLNYVLTNEQLLTIVVTPQTIEVESTPFDAELHRLLRQASEPGYRPLTYLVEASPLAAGKPAWATLTALSDRLIPKRARERLTSDHRLLIVASGPLHGLPWAAMPVGGDWLVNRATPQLLPGLRIWQQLMQRRPGGGGALLVGVSEFGPHADALDNVPAMLDIVEARWPGPTVRLEQAAASVEDLLDRARRGELRSYGLLHFATHGELAAMSGLYAHLKLADGQLSYDEVMRLGIDGALVVLAACDGAAAEVLPGEELLSLSRAFLAAGARDVIASAWELYDAATTPFLDLLYARLADGSDPALALASAQREWLARYSGIDNHDLTFAAPLAWAGLRAIGAGALADPPSAPPASG